MYIRIAGAIIMMLTTASCQTAGSSAGNGPITLSSKVSRSYQEYLSTLEPLAFAVSADGKSSGRFYCSKPRNACFKTNEITEALVRCRNSTPKGPAGKADCKIFALKNKVVWNGPVTFKGQGQVQAKPAPVGNNSGIIMGQRPAKPAPVGDGPLTITETVNKDFQNYLDLQEPLAFAVSADGKNSGWFFCKTQNACATMDAAGNAVKYCNDSISQGEKTCKVLALKRDVAWKGRVLISPVK